MTPLEKILLGDEMVRIKRNQKRAVQILKAIERLSIQEARQLLGECKISLNMLEVQLDKDRNSRQPVPEAEKRQSAVLPQKNGDKIKVLYKWPGKPMSSIVIDNTLEAMQDAVGGYIETVTVLSDVVVICNEEARILDMPYNCKVFGIPFAGPILIVGASGDDFCDVPATVRSSLWGIG